MGTFNLATKKMLHAYFIKRHGAFDYRRGWMKMNCPSCGKQLKYGVNIGMNRTNCFSCGYNKQPLEVILELERLDTYNEVLAFLKAQDFDGYEYKEEKVELKQRIDTFLPEGFKLLNQGNSQLAKSARSYIKGRGFDINESSRKGWGYGTKGSHFGYIIIPFFSDNKLVYYNARNYLSNGPKYNNPTTEETGIGKSMLWYNSDALYLYNCVMICEGAFNAATMGDHGIASGGKFVSRYQINELIKSPINRVIILLDPDAKNKAIDLALALVDFKKVKVVYLPDGEDCNSFTKKKTMKLIYNTRYQDRRTLMKMKQQL